MVKYLKNQGNYKIIDFKGISYNEIRPIFEKVWDFNQHIEPMNLEHGSERMKSPEKIEEEDVDTQKEMKEVSKESGAKRKKSLPRKGTRSTVKRQNMELDDDKEDLKGYLDIVLREDVESLSTKYPIVDWKTYTLSENFMYYKIIRGDGSSKNYKILSLGSTSGIRACALRNFDLEVMELENTQNNALAKLPMLKLGEYEMWEIRIKQYFQIQDYALWEVIENGNSWVPIPVTTPSETGTSTATKMTVPSTTEEKTCKKNDVKARSLLLMALPNEHQLTFDQYVDAQSMFAAIKARFGGNEATKKTQKALLKQQYENFSASSSESLDSIFNRLQRLVSRLAILGVVTPPEDLNVKFLRSLPSEWDTHVVVWMNKPDFDTMGLDDLYNNFKIVEQKVKKSAGASNDDKNLAFVTTSGASSTNNINTVNPEVSTATTKVNTASTEICTASFSDATVYAFLSTQPKGSQLVHEDLEQLHDDDLEEMDLKWIQRKCKRLFSNNTHGAEVSTEDANHKFLRSLPPAWSNLAMTMRTNPEINNLSIDDLYNNLRVFEQEIQGASKTSSSAQNVSFVSQSKSSTNKVKSGFSGAYSSCTPSTSSTNILEKEVLAGFADEVIYSLFAKQSEDWDLLHVDLEQIDDVDIEEMDINWQIAMIAIRMKKFYKKTGRRVHVDGKTPVGFDKKKLGCFNCHNTGHFAGECTAKGTHDGKNKRDSFYQHQEARKQEKNQMGLLTMDDGIVNWGEHTEAEEINHALMAISSSNEVTLCSKTCIDSYNTIKTLCDEQMNQLANDDPRPIPSVEQVTITTQKSQSQKHTPPQTVDPSCAQHVKPPRQPIRTPVTPSPIPSYKRQNWNQRMERELGAGYSFERKSCFVCGSLSHLIKDCDYYEKKMAREAALKSKRVVHTNDRQATPAWNNTNRINKANQFNPRPVNVRPNLSTASNTFKTGRVNVNTGHGNINSGSVHVNAGTQIKSGASRFNTGKQHVNSDRMYVNSGTQNKSGGSRVNTGKQNVNTARVHVNTARWIVWAHDGTGPILKIIKNYPKWDLLLLEEVKVVSVEKICDKKLNVLFTEKECFVVSSDFKMPDENPGSFLTKASSDEAKLWHRRLGHLNFKNLNKLVKDNLVRGLPSKSFKTDHTCVACQKGKQHKASFEEYQTMQVTVWDTDDLFQARFCWVFFLAKKDETSNILKTFIKQIENQLNQKVKIIRSDNGTEFKNRVMLEFCGDKGIKQEFSNARTPQQNGVAERMNRTLIEAARTMLADSHLPTTFWAEAVNTACYTFNRVRVTKPQNKTPYELLFGHKPILSYIRPFGCHVTILNTLSPLGKFDEKSDEGFLVGYSVNSKAFRVYNLVTKRVEVNLHVNFLEEKPNVQGIGHRWMFDLDYLTDSMNYIPVSLQNQANPAGSKEVIDIDVQTEEDADLMVVSSTEATRKAAIVWTALALKHLGPVPATAPTSTNPVNTGSDNLNTGFEEVNSGNIEANSPSADHDEEVFSDADDDEMPEIRIYVNKEGIFEKGSYDDDGIITDFNNLPDNDGRCQYKPHYEDLSYAHPQSQILGDPNTPVQTRSSLKKITAAHALVSHLQAQQRSNHKDHQHCLFACFYLNMIPKESITALEDESWVEARKETRKDERGVCLSETKPRAGFSSGHRQEEGIGTMTEYFCSCSKNRSYQVYKVVKALYGLHQAPRAWYATLSTFLVKHGYRRGTIDKTLFIRRNKKDIMLVQVSRKGIFISQDKYVAEILKKFDLVNVKALTITTMENLMLPLRQRIGKLLMTDIMYAVCVLFTFSGNSKDFSSQCCQEIFKYLKGKPNLGLWYPRESPLDLEAFSDSLTIGGSQPDRKNTTNRFHLVKTIFGGVLLQVLRGWFLEISCNNDTNQGMGQIGYPTNGTFTFWKSFFTPQWRYLVHHLLHCISSKSGGWDQFGSNIATALICLSTGRVYNFSKLIFDGMMANLKNKKKFLMYPCFLQIILNIQTENKHPYLAVSLTKKIFGNMKRGFQGAPRPLLPSMLLVATNPIAGQEHAAQAQSQPLPPPPPIPSPTPTPIPTSTSPPPLIPSPTPTPIPTPTSPPPPPETEPTTDEYLYEKHSPVHHHFSPSQEQAPSRMPMDDLLHTVPKLISRIDSLELDLKQTKLTMGNAIVKLVKKVKKLEGFLKRRNLVLTDSEDEEPEAQGRKSQADPQDSSIQGLEDNTGAEKINTAGEINAASIEVNTASKVNTGSIELNTVIEQDSTAGENKGQREGKAPMLSEETPKKTKEQILQEEASLAEAIRLDSLQKEEEAEQIHLDALLAQRIAEEEEISRACLEVNFKEKILLEDVDLVYQGEVFCCKKGAQALKGNKPMTPIQLRLYMMNYLKNQGSWKLNQLRKLSFEEVKEEFDKLVKQIESFAPISFEATKDSLKRFGEELQTKTPKRMKERRQDG
ncbi:putative ribonuclease H-like domain-containing protein [Tanacetum coccineum]